VSDLPPLASLQEFSARLGYTPEGVEAERAEALLDEASELIRDEAGEDWVDSDSGLGLVPRRVVKICLAVAYRAFVNPEALTQRGIGDSNKSYDRTRREGGEAVYLTEAERKAIRRAAGASTFTAVTLTSPYSGEGVVDSLAGS